MTTTIDKRQTLEIETTGDTIELEMHGRDVLEVVIRGDGAADYALDVQDTGNNGWMQDVDSTTFTGGTDYSETLTVGAAQVRIRVSSGTAASGDQADVLLSASGK